MVEFSGGITWQNHPTVKQSTSKTEGANWYISGVERVELLSTNGWRHKERTIYLQEAGCWHTSTHYFETEEIARNALCNALGKTQTEPVSAFALAMQKAKAK